MAITLILFSMMIMACQPDTPPTNSTSEMETIESAKVTAVSSSGSADNYNFSVTIASPDTGCDQYADWWEIMSPDGTLLYRRILAHSHVDEQPFTRSGGPVRIGPDTEVIVRAHMNNLGYGRQVMRGSASGGFEEVTLETTFAAALETTEPLPGDCAF